VRTTDVNAKLKPVRPFYEAARITVVTIAQKRPNPVLKNVIVAIQNAGKLVAA
jgi:hypothetical protein